VGIFVNKNVVKIKKTVLITFPKEIIFSIDIKEKINVIAGKTSPGHLLFCFDRKTCKIIGTTIKISRKKIFLGKIIL